MRASKFLPMIAVLAALAFAGCGGGGGDPTTTSKPATTEAAPSPTKHQLIAQGDGICAEVNAAVGSVAASESGVPNEITQVSTLYNGMVERLKELGTPKEEDGYAELMAAADALAKVEGEVKLAAEREDTTALGEAASKAAPALEEFETQAAVYGFEDCSEGPSAPTAPAGAGSGEEEEEGGVEAEPEAIEEAEVEEVAPEEVAPETGGAGGAPEEAPPAGGGTGAGAGESGGGSESGGVGPG
ncbi:MAG TPA: hypothetical protein VGC49_02695 [Solirubrobacterales bacterium]|jgi:hypothetical protein